MSGEVKFACATESWDAPEQTGKSISFSQYFLKGEANREYFVILETSSSSKWVRKSERIDG